MMNQRQGHGCPRLTGVCEEWRLYRVCQSLLCFGIHRQSECLCWSLSLLKADITGTWASQLEQRVIKEGDLRNHVDGHVHVCCLPKEAMAPGWSMGRKQADGGSVMLWCSVGQPWYWNSCGYYIDTYIMSDGSLFQHYYAPADNV